MLKIALRQIALGQASPTSNLNKIKDNGRCFTVVSVID